MGEKILIIEDDAESRDSLRMLLEKCGFYVHSSCNGETGIKMAKELNPNLIICDIIMPGLNGYDVLAELTKDSQTSGIPFLFLTARTEIGDLRKGMDLGADDYLFKPFKRENLLTAIQIRLQKHRNIRKSSQVGFIGTIENKLNEYSSLIAKVGEKQIVIKVHRINVIVCENQYTYLYLDNGEKHIFRKSLKHWESILPDTLFSRVHRSTIVNRRRIIRIEKCFKRSRKIYIENYPEPLIISQRFVSKLKNVVSK